MKKFNQYKAIHNFMYPNEPLKSWINEGNFTNHFGSDWDSLMDLVSKIESTELDGLNGDILLESIGQNAKFILDDGARFMPDCHGNSKKEAIYLAAVAFIEGYNKL